MTRETFGLAYEQALRFLGPRFLSEKELSDKLTRKGYEKDIVTAVLEKLCELDYINDNRLAVQVTQHYIREEKYGPFYIVQKMRMRGLTADRNLLNRYDQKSALFKQLERKYPLQQGPYDMAKVYRYFQYRGFAGEVIRAACSEYFE